MCIHACAQMYVYIYVSHWNPNTNIVFLYISVHTCFHECMCLCIFIKLYTHIHTHMCTHTHIHTRMCTHTYMYTCKCHNHMCTYISICMPTQNVMYILKSCAMHCIALKDKIAIHAAQNVLVCAYTYIHVLWTVCICVCASSHRSAYILLGVPTHVHE